ncbi:MAG: hypothetical protein OXE41_07645 [Gammaproteobacteria bacterium]|nr:hypothetical protein [Gammaproteobacteria bacterium]
MGNNKSEHYYGDVRLLGKRNQNYPAQSGTNCPIPFNLIWESSSDLLRKITPPLWLQIATKPFSPDTIQWFRKACQSGTLAREFCECE